MLGHAGPGYPVSAAGPPISTPCPQTPSSIFLFPIILFSPQAIAQTQSLLNKPMPMPNAGDDAHGAAATMRAGCPVCCSLLPPCSGRAEAGPTAQQGNLYQNKPHPFHELHRHFGRVV